MLAAKARVKCEAPQTNVGQKRCLAASFLVRFVWCRLKIEPAGRGGLVDKGSVTPDAQCRHGWARERAYSEWLIRTGRQNCSGPYYPGVAWFFKVRVETLRAGTIHNGFKLLDDEDSKTGYSALIGFFGARLGS